MPEEPKFEKGEVVQVKTEGNIEGRRLTVIEVNQGFFNTYRFKEISGRWREDLLKKPEPTIAESQYKS